MRLRIQIQKSKIRPEKGKQTEKFHLKVKRDEIKNQFECQSAGEFPFLPPGNCCIRCAQLFFFRLNDAAMELGFVAGFLHQADAGVVRPVEGTSAGLSIPAASPTGDEDSQINFPGLTPFPTFSLFSSVAGPDP